MDRNMRITTIDLVAPKNNQEVVNAMFSIIESQPWAIDFADAIETAMDEGYFVDLPDDYDLDY